MTIARINGTQLFYEVTGSGRAPLVLVHGSWVSRRSWASVAPKLGASFRVVTYDRRGHSDSERTAAQGSVREDVADLAGLIEHLAIAPAFVAANSFGASIALRLVGERPELVRGVIAHEPPLVRLLADDPDMAPMLDEVGRRVGAVAARIASGDSAGAAEQFAETVALGPGSWAQLPPEDRRAMADNAATFLDETNDPEALAIDLGAIRNVDRPILLTMGRQSPPMFAAILRKLAEALPQAELMALAGVGHVPHVSHPELYVETVSRFIQAHGGD